MKEIIKKIYYIFYEKPTKNQYVISKDSAMPINKKIQTLGQEIFRRLHNTKAEIDWEVKVRILEKFMAEVKASGYTEKDRYEILRSGIGSYRNLKKKEEEGLRPFFRNKFFERNQRIQRKEIGLSREIINLQQYSSSLLHLGVNY